MTKKKKLLSTEIKHIDIKINSRISDILEAFQNTSFQSRNLSKCYRTLLQGN